MRVVCSNFSLFSRLLLWDSLFLWRFSTFSNSDNFEFALLLDSLSLWRLLRRKSLQYWLLFSTLPKLYINKYSVPMYQISVLKLCINKRSILMYQISLPNHWKKQYRARHLTNLFTKALYQEVLCTNVPNLFTKALY